MQPGTPAAVVLEEIIKHLLKRKYPFVKLIDLLEKPGKYSKVHILRFLHFQQLPIPFPELPQPLVRLLRDLHLIGSIPPVQAVRIADIIIRLSLEFL